MVKSPIWESLPTCDLGWTSALLEILPGPRGNSLAIYTVTPGTRATAYKLVGFAVVPKAVDADTKAVLQKADSTSIALGRSALAVAWVSLVLDEARDKLFSHRVKGPLAKASAQVEHVQEGFAENVAVGIGQVCPKQDTCIPTRWYRRGAMQSDYLAIMESWKSMVPLTSALPFM